MQLSTIGEIQTMTSREIAELVEQCITHAGNMFCDAVNEKRMGDAYGLDQLKINLLKLRSHETIRMMEISRGLI